VPTLTFHLTPADWWAASAPDVPLSAPWFAKEAFIHCTTGADEMVSTANRHYRSDPRDFVVLTVDLDRLTSPWRADDERRIYPHVFGPIDRAAILEVRPMPRRPDGTFVPFDGSSGEVPAA
jgi:uncharacterized protein (DUF952 family)